MKITAILLSTAITLCNISAPAISDVVEQNIKCSMNIYHWFFYDMQHFINHTQSFAEQKQALDEIFNRTSLCLTISIQDVDRNGATITVTDINYNKPFVVKTGDKIDGIGFTVKEIQMLANSNFWVKVMAQNNMTDSLVDVKVCFYMGSCFALIQTTNQIYCVDLHFSNNDIISQNWRLAGELKKEYAFLTCETYMNGEKIPYECAAVNKNEMLFSLPALVNACGGSIQKLSKEDKIQCSGYENQDQYLISLKGEEIIFFSEQEMATGCMRNMKYINKKDPIFPLHDPEDDYFIALTKLGYVFKRTLDQERYLYIEREGAIRFLNAMGYDIETDADAKKVWITSNGNPVRTHIPMAEWKNWEILSIR